MLYTPDKPIWHTDTKGAKDVRLLLQDDRNLVLYGFDGPAWASNHRLTKCPWRRRRPPRRPRRRRWFRPRSRNPLRQRSPNRRPPPAADGSADVHRGVWGYAVAISERFYGDGSKYQVIADASGISNPDLIYPGQVLTIP